jgi:hypothetical protein
LRNRKPIAVVSMIVVALVAAAVFVHCPRAPLSRITRENFDRIGTGPHWGLGDPSPTKRAELEALLGSPGDYRTGLTLRPPRAGNSIILASQQPPTCLAWEGDTLSIHVYVDPSGTVVFKDAMTNRPADQDTAEAILWRAKRQWRKWFPQ